LTFHVGSTEFTTDAIPYNASAEQVRQTIQNAIAVGETNDLNLRAYLVDKVDVIVDRYPSANLGADVYVLSFQGELRKADFGPGLDTVVVHSSLTGPNATATVTTRMDGIDYYGFETVNIATGSGAAGDVFNVQGTSAGSNGFAITEHGTAVTNVTLNGGNDEVYVSSNADLDHVSSAGFQFLTGNLDDVRGALNVDFGLGTGQRFFLSDEASSHADSWSITDSLDHPWQPLAGSAAGLDTSGEIFVTRAGTTGISYKADAAADLFGGVAYWTGSGDDHVTIDGTHYRDGARTTTLLNTGLGNDTVDVNLAAAANPAANVERDGFFVLNTMGGSASDDPLQLDPGTFASDDDTVNAGLSTLPLIVFGGIGNDRITTGSGNDIVFGDFGRVQYGHGATYGFGGRGDVIDSTIEDPSYVLSRQIPLGGHDTVATNDGNDIVIGGASATQANDLFTAVDDTISTGNGSDVVLGDQGEISLLGLAAATETAATSTANTIELKTIQPAEGGNDTIATGNNDDVVLGGFGLDTIDLGAGNDVAIGDNGIVHWFTQTGVRYISDLSTTADDLGSNDTIYGRSGDDVLVGGTQNDAIDGGTESDLIFGDNVSLTRLATFRDYTNPRFRLATANPVYDANGNAVVGTVNQVDPRGTADWRDFQITLRDHTDAATPTGFFGSDYIAGGEGDDTIFGQLGNDVVQGDGSIDLTFAASPVLDCTSGTVGSANWSFQTLVGACRSASNALELHASTDVAPNDAARGTTDGNDYIEGNGGNDTIFGNQGQDDIVGGSSDLFSLASYDSRVDNVRDPGAAQGADMIFGGSGNDVAFGDPGVSTANAHASDADVIVGDNGDIFRILNSGGSFARYNYDNYAAAPASALDSHIVVRVVSLLDYSVGGPDYNGAAPGDPTRAVNPTTHRVDRGGTDEIHGENGDDTIYGMTGNDVIFGDAQNDTIVGGYGADWISGGTGDDGILGDDGRLYVSRNSASYGEPLYGIAAIAAGDINLAISTPGNMQLAITNPDGVLKYTADLMPDNLDPALRTAPSTSPNELYVPLDANDIIFGGLGNDSIHGGAGDDAISGAEATGTPSYLIAY
ncbi:MAG: hypothetical protein QOK22_1768, partial [Gaiellaceae bacterium]|nr:hypothetical protein [Gaiellaceae bacterium]